MSTTVQERPAARYRGSRRGPRLPLAPLLAIVEARGGYAACAPDARGHRETLDRAWERAKAEGAVTFDAADRLAIRLLGLHPMLVWGEDWLATPDRV